ncbi:unnamed protein product [Ectocarpus sp. 13 AM-2016]
MGHGSYNQTLSTIRSTGHTTTPHILRTLPKAGPNAIILTVTTSKWRHPWPSRARQIPSTPRHRRALASPSQAWETFPEPTGRLLAPVPTTSSTTWPEELITTTCTFPTAHGTYRLTLSTTRSTG